MPPVKNLVIVAVVVGLVYLLIKIYFHSQESAGSSNNSLPPLPIPANHSRSTNQ